MKSFLSPTPFFPDSPFHDAAGAGSASAAKPSRAASWNGESGKKGVGEKGFSLIEVIITIGILMTLTIAVASMLRAGFDVKQGLSQRSRVVHRLSVAIQKTADDVQHTFFVSTKDLTFQKNGIGRRTKGIFKIDRNGQHLVLTTKTHRPTTVGSYESDLTLVSYELKDSKTARGRKDLFRGETKVIPEDLKEEPPLRLLARNIKSFYVEAWTGESFAKEAPWDTGNSDTRNLLPKMVRITIEAWSEDRKDDDGQDEAQVDQATDKISTVVYLSDSWEYAEKKTGTTSIKWESF